MFKVNRQDGAAQFINTEGDFVVTVSKVEEALDNKGREVCKVTFKTDDGSSTSDRFINHHQDRFNGTLNFGIRHFRPLLSELLGYQTRRRPRSRLNPSRSS